MEIRPKESSVRRIYVTLRAKHYAHEAVERAFRGLIGDDPFYF